MDPLMRSGTSDIRALVFDLDRTLVDVQSFTDYATALADAKDLIASWPAAATPATGWDGPTRACMDLLVALSGDPRWQVVSDAIERHEQAAITRSVAMPGLRALLDATAHLPRAVATLLPAGAARAALDRHAIAVDALVARRPDLAPKPAADPCVAAAAALGFADRLGSVLMVGDSTWDLACARAAGAAFVGLRNGGRSEFPPDVDTVEDLGELVRRF
jgi:phosphoglycolate phosphatase-like HAD superfamily hydrolase